MDLRPSQTYWGQWRPAEGLIILNEKLVMEGNWKSVIGILGHEVAHQIVSKIYPHSSSLEHPHGQTFQNVCKRIELDPFYWSAQVDLLNGDSPPPTPFGKRRQEAEEHPILAKVKKLLALASSAESHEAAAALSAVERLLTNHNLEMPIDTTSASPFERWQIPLGKMVTFQHNLIANILIEFFFVETVFTYEYDVFTNQTTRILEILGKPVSLAMAEYVWHFMMERCSALWQAYKPTARLMGEKGLGAKNIFITNLLKAFTRKMRKEKQLGSKNSQGSELSNGTSLIEAHDKELKKFLKYNYPRLTYASTRSSSSRPSPCCANAGMEAGNALTIHSPVGNSNSSGVQGRIGGRN
jgi:hypothetical protein